MKEALQVIAAVITITVLALGAGLFIAFFFMAAIKIGSSVLGGY